MNENFQMKYMTKNFDQLFQIFFWISIGVTVKNLVKSSIQIEYRMV